MQHKNFPIGIQTFQEIRERDLFYMDKTELVYKMAHGTKNNFLSRPRRFGKSLLLTTLQAYFEGKKELFKGLAMGKLEKDWTVYPVIRLDLSSGKYYSLSALKSTVNNILSDYEEVYHLRSASEDTFGVRLTRIIKAAYEKSHRQVVVLVDEYDAPLLDSNSDELLQGEIRNRMRDFFSPLKAQSELLRFVFLTGITKFSQLSIFSELNNLNNFSMDDDYAAVCGFTKEEVLTCLKDDILALAESNNMSYDEAVEELKAEYDGYHFSAGSPDIFNPYSLLNVLYKKKFNDYWYTTGTPTFLVELLQRENMDMLQLTNIQATESRFNTPTEHVGDPVPVLYQAGYLTIKGYDRLSRLYRLSFPNREVSRGFANNLVQYYTPKAPGFRDAVYIAYVDNVLREENMGKFIAALKRFYDKFPYTLVNNNERHYQAVFFTILTLVGADVSPELPTSDGRIDMVMKTRQSIYVFELKYKRDAETAMEQINAKNYLKAFSDDRRRKYKVAINFSDDQRSIDDWRIEPAD
jgi:hypothetical protein